MEKIAILTIATGNYTNFLKELIESINSKFLINKQKHIYVFTNKHFENTNDVTYIYIPHLPWPLNTLLRFYYFKSITNSLQEFDFIYYMDSDTIVYDTIDETILPINDEIIGAHHHWEWNVTNSYDNTNTKSTAYVDTSSPDFVPEYCQACFFGANKNSFIKMTNELEDNINTDFKNNVIAKWHDESHFNKYILNNPKKILNSSYTHPAGVPFDENPTGVKIIHRNARWCFTHGVL